MSSTATASSISASPMTPRRSRGQALPRATSARTAGGGGARRPRSDAAAASSSRPTGRDLCGPRGHRHAVRRGLGARAAPRLRPRMVTALARLDGRPLGVIANDPSHLGGAIDAPGADKAARFEGLCDAFGLPLLFLADTPGSCRSDAERTATVCHFSRMFVTGANLSVPTATVVLRKGYGLAPRRWPPAASRRRCSPLAGRPSEFGAMGLEGAVKLGMRRELEAIEDPGEREARPPGHGGRRLRGGPRRQHGVLTSRSTTSSIRPTPVAGSPTATLTTRARRGGREPASAARTSTPGSRLLRAILAGRRAAAPRGCRRCTPRRSESLLIARSRPDRRTPPAAHTDRRRGGGG